jgi:serine/threonine protein kinase/WD40 repeat protein
MPPDTPPAPLDFVEFLDQLDADQRAGRTLPLSHYLARFPRIEPEVAAEFLRRHEAAHDGPPAEPAAATDGNGTHVSHYRLLRELGRGGQGSVHLAQDTRMGRLVALKLLPGGRAATTTAALRRFQREAEAIARLDHPSLCSVLEAEFDGETPFLAMRYIEGETLKARLARARDQSPPSPPPSSRELPAILLLIERVARALHAAHEAGILHRDIKPGNIQIDPEGRPVLLDFGLARIERDHDATMTLPGQVFGTLAYMAPEQTAGNRLLVDRRADVYALGVVLFECVAGRHPFAGIEERKLADQDQRPPAPDPRPYNPAIAAELAVVLATALAPMPGERYGSALALAEDLRRLREFEPIAARPASAWLRARRWIRRRRRPLAAATILLAAALGSVYAWLRNELQAHARAAVQLAAQARALAEVNPVQALNVCLLAAEASPDDETIHSTALAALQDLRELWSTRNVERLADQVTSFALGSDLVATGRVDGRWTLRDLRTGLQRAEMRGNGQVLGICALHGGAEFVATWQDGAVHAWRASQGFRALAPPDLREAHVLTVHAVPGREDQLLLVTREHDLLLWDRTRQQLRFRARHTNSPQVPTDQISVTFCADGASFATAMGQPVDRDGRPWPVDGRVMVWSTATGACLLDLGPHPACARSIEFSPDGSLLAIGFLDGTLRVHDVADGVLRYERKYAGQVLAVRFDRSGEHLAVGLMLRDPFDLDALARPIRVLAARTGAELHGLPGHGLRSVQCLEFSPGGEWLASGCNDGTICIRASFAAEPDRVLRRCAGRPKSLAWSADGQVMVSHDDSDVVTCWSVAQPAIRCLGPHPGRVTAARFSADGQWVATGCEDGLVRIWSAWQGVELRALRMDTNAVRRVEVSQDGRWLVASGDGAGVGLIDTSAGWRTLTLEGHAAPVTAMSLSSDGRFAATGAHNGEVGVIDLHAEPPTQRILGAHAQAVDCAAFAADGQHLLTGGGDRTVMLWNASTGALESTRQVFEPAEDPSYRRHVLAIAASPDRTSWVAFTDAMVIHTLGLRLDTGARTDNPGTAGHLVFDPAGERLALGNKYDGGCRLLAWPGLDRGERMPSHANLITHLAFSRSGRFLLTCSFDGTARLLRTDGALRPWARFSAHRGPVLDGDMSRDERWVVTASADGTARVWPTDPIAHARTLGFTRFALGDFQALQLIGR